MLQEDAQREGAKLAAEEKKEKEDLGLPERTAKVVDLSNKELARLPPELAEFTDLHLLTLKKNKLNALGPEIGALLSLHAAASSFPLHL